jgi:phage baseplate assembly protein W
MSTPVTLAEISGRDFSTDVSAFGQVAENLDDIEQCLRILLTTPKGSRPHEPLFGCDAWRYLDAPLSTAVPRMIQEIVAAVGMWEPRCRLKRVVPRFEAAAGGNLVLSVEWTLPNYEDSRLTEVAL